MFSRFFFCLAFGLGFQIAVAISYSSSLQTSHFSHSAVQLQSGSIGLRGRPGCWAKARVPARRAARLRPELDQERKEQLVFSAGQSTRRPRQTSQGNKYSLIKTRMAGGSRSTEASRRSSAALGVMFAWPQVTEKFAFFKGDDRLHRVNGDRHWKPEANNDDLH